MADDRYTILSMMLATVITPPTSAQMRATAPETEAAPETTTATVAAAPETATAAVAAAAAPVAALAREAYGLVEEPFDCFGPGTLLATGNSSTPMFLKTPIRACACCDLHDLIE